jgi:hypothetical protein
MATHPIMCCQYGVYLKNKQIYLNMLIHAQIAKTTVATDVINSIIILSSSILFSHVENIGLLGNQFTFI